MSLYIDKKFVSLLSPRLEKFHQKSDYLWNFRCPICGDSKKNKLKTRGYIYRRGSDLFFSCHNCGSNSSLGKFIKLLDPNLYADYNLEKFTNEKPQTTEEKLEELITKPFFAKTKTIELPTIESLRYDHYGKRYLMDRRIPKEFLSKLYWAQDFKAFVEEMAPEVNKQLHENESRIIIPFYSEDGKTLLGFQGRSMDPRSKVKYMTVKTTNDNLKIFGLERMNRSKKLYVVEGPLDSFFLTNAVATMDSTLYTIIPTLGNLDYVFVFDNQPRNKDVVKLMQKTINLGQNICIWPKGIQEKDINEMVMSGLTSSQVQGLIDRNTYNDLNAQLVFDDWRKI